MVHFCDFWESVSQKSPVSSVILLPLRHALAHALLEGEGEGVVVAVATLAGQLLNGEEMLGSDGLAVKVDEMTDAQVVDVGIISDALHGKAFAQDLEVANADGVTIYYNWINDNKELAVTYLGSSSYTRQERTLPSSSGQKG